ncbi:hypothetical protein [Nostoc sp.]|uniref:hypothetical protein n=1 Tax=Nostoc sp. TaxID=1180 RepID=UPI002FF7314A
MKTLAKWSVNDYHRMVEAGILRNATAEIQEYWVLNLSAKQMIVFRNPQNGKYVEKYTIGEGMITPLAFADVSVSVQRLLS